MLPRLVIVLGLVAGALTGAACAATPVSPAAPDAPLVIAQAPAAPSSSPAAIEPVYPADQAGVRAAAKAGPQALRQYVHRTRMIHHFSYWDFAPRT
jgi:hypothetical protein